MRDNLLRYCDIRAGLRQRYRRKVTGRFAQYLTMLAHFVSGVVGSKRGSTSVIVRKAPTHARRRSHIRWRARQLQNQSGPPNVYSVPCLVVLFRSLL